MATAPLDPAASSAPTGLRLVAHVGVARWTILLTAQTVVRLDQEHPEQAADGLGAVALHRVMEGVRAKAVGLRWYGGGTMAIDPSDLAEAPMVEGEAADQAVAAAPWYDIVEIAPAGPPVLRLMA